MKVLLDHNIDRRFARLFSDFQVATTQQMGWSDLLNGDLLKCAEQDGFGILITADFNIQHQQNLTGRRISILVLRSPNNPCNALRHDRGSRGQLGSIRPGEIAEVFHPVMRKK